MTARAQLYLGRGDADAGDVRDALAGVLRARMTSSSELVEVEPREHADVHVQIGPLGPLPWVLPWMAFECEGVDGEGAVDLARWVSQQLSAEVLVVLEQGLTEVQLLLFRAGETAAPPALPDVAATADSDGNGGDDGTEEDAPRDERTRGEKVTEALGLHGSGSTLGGMMLVAFRRREEVRFVDGPPALAQLSAVFVDPLEVPVHELRRLRLRAHSAGGDGRGARVVVGGSALAHQLVVVTRTSWESERATREGADDEAPFASREGLAIMTAELPEARLPAARADGVLQWTEKAAALGDEQRIRSGAIYVEVDVVAGGHEGKGELIVRVDPHGAQGGAVVFVPVVVKAISS